MVSIILPTYNRAGMLEESIRSVLQQSYSDFELVIMDDGSDDGTREIVMSIPDHRIKYFQLPHSGYTGRLKNFAIRESSGEYIAFIDSDDMWKAGKLEKQMKLFSENPSIGFSITDVTTFRDNTILINHSYQLQNTIQIVNIFELLKQSRFLVYPATLVIRKSCLDRMGYFSESMLSGDYNFNMRLAFYFDAGVIYETLVWRRVHDTNMSEQIPFENYGEYIDTFDYLYKEGMVEKEFMLKAKSVAFYKMGKLYAAGGKPAKARSHFFSSLKNKPFNLRCALLLLNTFFSKTGVV